jgi:hypothetical protein
MRQGELHGVTIQNIILLVVTFVRTSNALLANCFMLVSCLAVSSTLKMEVTCSFETLVDFQRLLGIISQKIEHFITTAVRTTNQRCNLHGPKLTSTCPQKLALGPIVTVESTPHVLTLFLLRHIFLSPTIHAYTALVSLPLSLSYQNFYICHLPHVCCMPHPSQFGNAELLSSTQMASKGSECKREKYFSLLLRYVTLTVWNGLEPLQVNKTANFSENNSRKGKVTAIMTLKTALRR